MNESKSWSDKNFIKIFKFVKELKISILWVPILLWINLMIHVNPKKVRKISYMLFYAYNILFLSYYLFV